MATNREITASNILALLSIVADKKWTIKANVIRDENDRCPICSIANEIDPSITHKGSVYQSLRELGIYIPFGSMFRAAENVMEAADGVNLSKSSVRKIRTQMMRILNPEVIK